MATATAARKEPAKKVAAPAPAYVPRREFDYRSAENRQHFRAAVNWSLQLARMRAEQQARQEAQARAWVEPPEDAPPPVVVPVLSPVEPALLEQPELVAEQAETSQGDQQPEAQESQEAKEPRDQQGRLSLRYVLAVASAYLRQHPETADECALRGLTQRETIVAVAHQIFGDRLYTEQAAPDEPEAQPAQLAQSSKGERVWPPSRSSQTAANSQPAKSKPHFKPQPKRGKQPKQPKQSKQSKQSKRPQARHGLRLVK